jgi:hypothetical protein
MGVYPKDYNKDSFLAFLRKNNVSDKIIDRFNELPEIIKHKGHEYKLNIVSTWYSIGNTHYNFELNYYSEEIIEYLFSSKVFTDVERSINYLLCELINAKFVEKQK